MAFDVGKIHQKLQDIKTIATGGEWKGDSEFRDKILLFQAFCDQRLKSPYRKLTSDTDLTSLDKSLETFITQTKQYQANNNPSTLNQIQVTFHNTLSIISKIPFAGAKETQQTLSTALDNFLEQNESIIQSITREKIKLEEEVSGLQRKVTAISADVDKKTSELNSWQEIFLNKQEERSSSFSEDQERRKEKFNELCEEFEKEFNENTSRQKERFSTESAKFSDEFRAKLSEMREIEGKIRVIYNIVGEVSQIGLQKQYANSEKKTADWLFYFAAATMFVVILITVYPAISNASNFDWKILLYRLPLAAAFLVPAFYLANESKKHRDKENKYRELEIKLQNIRPFFNEIKSEDKEKVQLELGKMLLSPSEYIPDKNIILPPDIIEALGIAAKKNQSKPD